jgi:hypothetical protein
MKAVQRSLHYARRGADATLSRRLADSSKRRSVGKVSQFVHQPDALQMQLQRRE